jgi:hypothetical protein
LSKWQSVQRHAPSLSIPLGALAMNTARQVSADDFGKWGCLIAMARLIR